MTNLPYGFHAGPWHEKHVSIMAQLMKILTIILALVTCEIKFVHSQVFLTSRNSSVPSEFMPRFENGRTRFENRPAEDTFHQNFDSNRRAPSTFRSFNPFSFNRNPPDRKEDDSQDNGEDAIPGRPRWTKPGLPSFNNHGQENPRPRKLQIPPWSPNSSLSTRAPWWVGKPESWLLSQSAAKPTIPSLSNQMEKQEETALDHNGNMNIPGFSDSRNLGILATNEPKITTQASLENQESFLQNQENVKDSHSIPPSDELLEPTKPSIFETPEISGFITNMTMDSAFFNVTSRKDFSKKNDNDGNGDMIASGTKKNQRAKNKVLWIKVNSAVDDSNTPSEGLENLPDDSEDGVLDSDMDNGNKKNRVLWLKLTTSPSATTGQASSESTSEISAHDIITDSPIVTRPHRRKTKIITKSTISPPAVEESTTTEKISSSESPSTEKVTQTTAQITSTEVTTTTEKIQPTIKKVTKKVTATTKTPSTISTTTTTVLPVTSSSTTTTTSTTTTPTTTTTITSTPTTTTTPIPTTTTKLTTKSTITTTTALPSTMITTQRTTTTTKATSSTTTTLPSTAIMTKESISPTGLPISSDKSSNNKTLFPEKVGPENEVNNYSKSDNNVKGTLNSKDLLTNRINTEVPVNDKSHVNGSNSKITVKIENTTQSFDPKLNRTANQNLTDVNKIAKDELINSTLTNISISQAPVQNNGINSNFENQTFNGSERTLGVSTNESVLKPDKILEVDLGNNSFSITANRSGRIIGNHNNINDIIQRTDDKLKTGIFSQRNTSNSDIKSISAISQITTLSSLPFTIPLGAHIAQFLPQTESTSSTQFKIVTKRISTTTTSTTQGITTSPTSVNQTSSSHPNEDQENNFSNFKPGADSISWKSSFKIINGIDWHPNMADKKSSEYKTLAKSLINLLNDLFKNSMEEEYEGVSILNFIKGSVIVDYILFLKPDNPMKSSRLEDEFKDYLNEHNGKIGNYTVEYSKVQFEVLGKSHVSPDNNYVETAGRSSFVLPQWAVATIVIGCSTVIFIVIFIAVMSYHKSRNKRRFGRRLQDMESVSKSWEKISSSNEIQPDGLYSMDDVFEQSATNPGRKKRLVAIQNKEMSLDPRLRDIRERERLREMKERELQRARMMKDPRMQMPHHAGYYNKGGQRDVKSAWDAYM